MQEQEVCPKCEQEMKEGELVTGRSWNGDGGAHVNCSGNQSERAGSITEGTKMPATDGFTLLAQQAIENEARVCFDVCANLGQIFGNVKHMAWFVDAVAQELSEQYSAEEIAAHPELLE